MRSIALASIVLAACALRGVEGIGVAQQSRGVQNADTLDIAATARALSADSMRGRGPYTAENLKAARFLAARLEKLGARPAVGSSVLVPFVAPDRQGDTVYNVAAILRSRTGGVDGELVGITAHLDHLGVGRPDAEGDSIYNGFLDAAVPMAMVLDVARRYSAAPGDRPLLVLFFNMEERGLIGSRAFVAHNDAAALLQRLRLVIGVDAGSPAGEAVEWQLMGTLPTHRGAQIVDSLARERGWSTTSTAPRPISDVFVFSEKGVPIVFPIPGRTWKGYTEAERTAAMSRFDHYHQPSDEWHPEFPWTGTAAFADWLWESVRAAADARVRLR